MNITTRKPATPWFTATGQNTAAQTWTPKPPQPQYRGTISGRTSLDSRRLMLGDQIIVAYDWADLTDKLVNELAEAVLLREQFCRHIINCRDVEALPDEVLKHMVMVSDRLSGTNITTGLISSYTDTRKTDAYLRRIWRYLQEQLAGNGIDVPDWPVPADQPAGRPYPTQTKPGGATQQHPIWNMFKQLADINTTIGDVTQLVCVLETTKPAQPDTEATTAPAA